MGRTISRRSILQGTAAAAATGSALSQNKHSSAAQPRPFLLSATVAAPDDFSRVAFTPQLLRELLERMKWMGVRRIYWEYHGDIHTGYWANAVRRPRHGTTGVALQPGNSPVEQSLRNFGGHPIHTAVPIARQLGLEVFGIIKPYETGHSSAEPLGSPDTLRFAGLPRIGGYADLVYPWVLRHPEFRLRARSTALSKTAAVPIRKIELRKQDDSPTRVRSANLQIWTSPANYQYRRKEVSFQLRERVEPAQREVREINGRIVTRKGAPVRVLTLEGLELTDPFVAVTTNFPEDQGDFRNTAVEMVKAYGPDGELPIVVASHRSTWRRVRDFQSYGLEFDGGLGDILVTLDVNHAHQACSTCLATRRTDCIPQELRPGFPLCRDGVIAFAQGRNEYVTGGLCEAYPETQELWLSWIAECIAAGADGVDIRISNHSTWSDYMSLYGFNDPVLEEYKRRYGVDPDRESYDARLFSELRGEFFDQFLKRAKRKLAAAGKKLQLHLEAESFREDAPQVRNRTRPGNTTFHWKHWLESGLADEATLMMVAWDPERALQDGLVREMLGVARSAGVPVSVRDFIWNNRDGKYHADQLARAASGGTLSGFNFYETAAFYDMDESGRQNKLIYYPGLMEEIRSQAAKLGLI